MDSDNCPDNPFVLDVLKSHDDTRIWAGVSPTKPGTDCADISLATDAGKTAVDTWFCTGVCTLEMFLSYRLITA